MKAYLCGTDLEVKKFKEFKYRDFNNLSYRVNFGGFNVVSSLLS
jgi:hypothetical protein